MLFDTRLRRPVAEMLDTIVCTDDVIRHTPPFTMPPDFDMTDDLAAQTYADENRLYLLTHCFPATTFSAGANPVDPEGEHVVFNGEYDMDTMRNGWWGPPGDNGKYWNHGDFRDGALYYVKNVLRQIVQQGNLE